MSYFFGFPSLFTYEEKKASSVKSTEEEKLTKGREEKNEQQESKDIMGSTSRKGWLDWQFWKKSDNSSGPFGAFRKNNKNTGASENGGEEGKSKVTESVTKTDCREYGGKSDHRKNEPPVLCNDRARREKDLAMAHNMTKMEPTANTRQNGPHIWRGTAPGVSVREEKYSPNGQAQSANTLTMNPEGVSNEVTSSPANNQKITTKAKPKTAIRQLPTAPKEQKRTGPQQVVPTALKTTQREATAAKFNPGAKIIDGKKNVEIARIDKKNEVRKGGDPRKTAVKTNEGLNQTQKSVRQKPVIARANLTKIDEKPSISSGPGETAVKTGATGQKDAVAKQIVDKSKTEATAQEAGSKKIGTSQQPPVSEGVNLPPQNQKLTRPQNSGAQVPKQNVVANIGLKNGSKPPSVQPSLAAQQQQQRVDPQTLRAQNTGPQNAKSQNVGPQCPKPSAKEPRYGEKINHKLSPQTGSNWITSQPQAPVVQQSRMQKPVPPASANQQFPITQNQSEFAPLPKRSYSEVVKPQHSCPQRPRPEGVSPQASPVRAGAMRQKQLVNRRKAPGFAKPLKPVDETLPPSGETTRQDPKESDNVPKRKILYSRDGREVVVEPNMPVTLPGSLVSAQENKNVSKPTDFAKKLYVHNTMAKNRPGLPAIKEIPAQQVFKPVKPDMKDASTCTLTPSIFVDVAVQVPDEEENAGDEIQDLLVKRPWDTERVMKMQVLLDEKLVVQGRMKEVLRKRQDELKSTKKRCLELETVIKASNMQGKPQLVAQVNELTDIKNELVDEVTNLTVELEKERTNVKSLKTELVDIKAQLTAARKKGANPTGQ